MSAPIDTITSEELHHLLDSPAPPRILDVRAPGEFETAHISGSYNVPLDVLDQYGSAIAEQLNRDRDVVLVCRSGQRAAKAEQLLRSANLTNGRVLQNGIIAWETEGFPVDRGADRWDLERQVRLVAGSIVLSAVLGSVVLPRLKWLAAAIGGGLTFAALSDTCAMGTALSTLPYNRGGSPETHTILSGLGVSPRPPLPE